MKDKLVKRFLLVMVPTLIVAFLIISVSLTFGTSDAGIALGITEGVIALLLGAYFLFHEAVNKFFHSVFGRFKKEKKEAA